LRHSDDPRVINVSSARASLGKSTRGNLPPTISLPYCVSKTALNMLTVEMAKAESGVLFQVVSPGHCRTAFNGFRGEKEPLDGARVVVEVVVGERTAFGSGFWEIEEGVMREVAW